MIKTQVEQIALTGSSSAEIASIRHPLDEISGAMGDKVKIVKLNVDESPKTASKYGVMSIPTLMIFKGGEMASRQVGAAPKQKLQQWITAAV